MRTLIVAVLALAVVCTAACSSTRHTGPYGAQGARVADASRDLRFGIYGTPAHPVEATGVGSCDVGLPPISPYDTGLVLTAQGVAAHRADGVPLSPSADAVPDQYRRDARQRGGPLTLIAGPTTPTRGLVSVVGTHAAVWTTS